MRKALFFLILSASAFGQSLISTTTSQAVTATQQAIPLASVSGITAGMDIYVDRELMTVGSISGKFATVQRGVYGTGAVAHASGTTVLAGQPQWFYNVDASGSCQSYQATPYVNVSNGNQYTCVNGVWTGGQQSLLSGANTWTGAQTFTGGTGYWKVPTSNSQTVYGGAPFQWNYGTRLWTGITDNIWNFGYNIANVTNGADVVAGIPSMWNQIEIDYNDGSNEWMETHLDYTYDGTTQYRPFAVGTKLNDHTYQDVSFDIGSSVTDAFAVNARGVNLLKLNPQPAAKLQFASLVNTTDYFSINTDANTVTSNNWDFVFGLSTNQTGLVIGATDSVTQSNLQNRLILCNQTCDPSNTAEHASFVRAAGQSLELEPGETSNTTTAGSLYIGYNRVPASTYLYGPLRYQECQLGGASGTSSPAACGANTSGMIAVPASQTTYTVNASTVTANSLIFIQQMSDNSGLPSSPTCSSTAANPMQSARVAATSFTFTLSSVAAVTCFKYWIVN